MNLNVFRPAGWEARYNVKVPMRDGVSLSCDIYSPRGQSGPFPVILVRTPYNNMTEREVETGEFFVQHGYVYVIQDVRGRNDSEGDFYPWVDEFNDGHDAIEWIAAQPWCDGNVGMNGGSYVAGVQWQAAMMGSRHLKCIVPRAIGDDLHESPYYQGGAFALALNVTWAFWAGEGRVWQNVDRYNWPQLLQALPIKDIAKLAGKDVKFLQDWIDHPDYDDYWKALSVKERYEDVEVPVFHMSGWYDLFPAGTFSNYLGMQERGGSLLARNNQKVVIGPWTHSLSTLTHAGDRDFGMESMADIRGMELKWYDHWLKGIDNGIEKEPPIRLFVMGTNEWRDEHEWPLARTRFTPYYFHSGGSATTLNGDGALSTQAPTDESPDSYEYNPAFPTPTLGGGSCCGDKVPRPGAFDQRDVEGRSDVLVYTSEPLDEDMEVTGPIIVKLHASTDARDTDFAAKLTDVHPDGYSLNLCDGIIRGRYRETTERQVLLEPGTVYEFTIDLWVTSNVFKKGHRIRVDIASSNFPRFDRNPNTGHKFAEDAEMQVAHQQVFHDGAHPSHIILPVIPSG